MSTYLADAAENLTVEGPSATFTYRRIGPRGGVPLVLLNRVRGTLDWWDPEFLDHLAADHDVIVFDNVGTGYTTGTPRDSVEGLADGTIEFIEALGLPQVDLLGWTLGGTVAQHIARTRPDLVRKLVVAAANPGGTVPGAPDPDPKVRATMTKPEVTGDDLVFLFFPETDTGRAAGYEHLARVATRLATGRPDVSEAAAMGQIAAIGEGRVDPLRAGARGPGDHPAARPVRHRHAGRDDPRPGRPTPPSSTSPTPPSSPTATPATPSSSSTPRTSPPR